MPPTEFYLPTSVSLPQSSVSSRHVSCSALSVILWLNTLMLPGALLNEEAFKVPLWAISSIRAKCSSDTEDKRLSLWMSLKYVGTLLNACYYHNNKLIHHLKCQIQLCHSLNSNVSTNFQLSTCNNRTIHSFFLAFWNKFVIVRSVIVFLLVLKSNISKE